MSPQVEIASVLELQHSSLLLQQDSLTSRISVSVMVLIALPGFIVLIQYSVLYVWVLI